VQVPAGEIRADLKILMTRFFC